MLVPKPKNIIPEFTKIALINNVPIDLKIGTDIFNFSVNNNININETKDNNNIKQEESNITIIDIITHFLIASKIIEDKYKDTLKNDIINTIMFDGTNLSVSTLFMSNIEIMSELSKMLKLVTYDFIKELKLTNDNNILLLEFIKRIIIHILNLFLTSNLLDDNVNKYMKLSSLLIYKFTQLTNMMIDINNKQYNDLQVTINDVVLTQNTLLNKLDVLVNL